ncbi:MAG: histidine kinase [Nitrospirae bacterium CG_4_10_14_0_8_um_filter_41_23]|nr:CBS domain-containing protein [Nitrospirota bacterium]OIP61451.1 MAG: histidine kinase [Nitrospirae bacterium CG2_30_41_42]PIQ93922.1 MAG: histidine kinase [Nitrospirae bacterium CG11_big_fil_rev_8_21_14_0_20_41_14]PIV43582.1 MAG: histidine kinase [Nitrospirae bacterium CG02_land_8_20_14_3_00_41_53]PIW86842.1 MAG: histidine kinase [Nitrospirae bacterium CG_4_8_14_3_um_filter_41_47]PIY85864.1 MAG: histidine kinase [Nitrospirae bacterium CG_4_10_14_0_8_um_filter_41_23]PJA80674.1 MAG: histidi
MKIEKVMTKKIEYIEADACVYDAIEKMVDRRIRSLVVKPRDEKDVYGVVTVRDIVFKVLGKNLDPGKIRVEEIASRPVVSIDRDMEIEHVISLMNKFNITRVFVHEGKEIIGVVSLLDVMADSLIERAKGGRVA